MADDVVFIVDLVQDVAILTPLIRLLKRETAISVSVLVSKKFPLRDVTRFWATALNDVCAQAGVEITSFETEWDVYRRLQGSRGFLVSASESSVPAHNIAHRVFRCAPSSFITVTLQHGFECVGFLHNKAHNRAYGHYIEFAADVLCSWFPGRALKSLAPEQGHKVFVAGPPSCIDIEFDFLTKGSGQLPTRSGPMRGLICENLHSVRLDSEGSRVEFLSEFFEFAKDLRGSPIEIVLRPHPAGRFTDARGIVLPDGVKKSDGSLGDTLALGIDFGISAPSTILFDMIKAGIPTAVWRDSDHFVDLDNYEGLPSVTNAREWEAFVMACRDDRDQLVNRQNDFLKQFEIPPDVTGRYLELFTAEV